MTVREKVSALILAGGRGTRMGRVDKGLQPFRGGTLVSHVMQRLAPQVAQVTINANRNLPQYEALGAPVLPDELKGFEGPLAGLQAGLKHCGTELLVTAPCDSPFLPPDLVQRLHDAMAAQDADLAVAATMEADDTGAARKQLHPVFSLMKASVLPQLEAYLATGARRMDGWHKGIKVAEVLFNDAAAFRNINTLAALQEEEARAAAPSLKEMAGEAAGALPVDEARRIIGSFIQPVQAVEKVALRAALDRVLAEDLVSPISVPAYDNSAMDGFAFDGAQLRTDAPTSFEIVASVFAGRPTDVAPGVGQCVRIMTGGLMPPGCDTVLPQEFALSITDSTLTVKPGSVRRGDNRRLKGEDLAAGSPALRRGKILSPADLGLIASLGIAEVPVRRRLRVAFFSTGDELRSIGEQLDEGCVYDSNRYTLYGMLTRLGCDIIDMGTVKDDPASLEAALRSACENADAVITSGGVSVGAADYTKQIMATLGEVMFWQLAMRPGRSMAFGRIASNGRSAYLFGLPGNPVAVMVSFYFFARHALLRMMGAENAEDRLLKVRSQGAIRKKPGRTEYQRGILSVGADGQQEVRITGSQGSGILRSMSEANCMVVLHDAQGDVAPGDWIDVIPFSGLV